MEVQVFPGDDSRPSNSPQTDIELFYDDVDFETPIECLQ